MGDVEYETCHLGPGPSLPLHRIRGAAGQRTTVKVSFVGKLFRANHDCELVNLANTEHARNRGWPSGMRIAATASQLASSCRAWMQPASASGPHTAQQNAAGKE